MEEGRNGSLICDAYYLCSNAKIYWNWTKADGHSVIFRKYDKINSWHGKNKRMLHLTPTADDHNTNITCVVQYDNSITTTTVTLTVNCKYAAVFILLDMNNIILAHGMVLSSVTHLTR